MTRYWQADPLQRKRFLRLRERYARRGKRLIHLDESGFAATAHRTHGYAPVGQRVYGAVSAQRRPRTSLIAARDGARLRACFLFEGTCSAAVFTLWLMELLTPPLTPNDVVLMDKAALQ